MATNCAILALYIVGQATDAAPQVTPRQLSVVFNVEEDKYRYPYRVACRERRDRGKKHPLTYNVSSGTGTLRTRW